MSDEDRPVPGYEIGHCKPPVATRFKPGQSGNPAGRKPGARSLRSLFLAAALAKPRGRYRNDETADYATHLEAMFARLLDEAARGSNKATGRVLALCEAYLSEELAAPDAGEDASADPV